MCREESNLLGGAVWLTAVWSRAPRCPNLCLNYYFNKKPKCCYVCDASSWIFVIELVRNIRKQHGSVSGWQDLPELIKDHILICFNIKEMNPKCRTSRTFVLTSSFVFTEPVTYIRMMSWFLFECYGLEVHLPDFITSFEVDQKFLESLSVFPFPPSWSCVSSHFLILCFSLHWSSAQPWLVSPGLC